MTGVLQGCFKGNLWLTETKEVVFTEFQQRKSFEIGYHNVGKFIRYEDIYVLEDTFIAAPPSLQFIDLTWVEEPGLQQGKALIDRPYDLRQIFYDSSEEEDEDGDSVELELADLPEEHADQQMHVEEVLFTTSPLPSISRGRIGRERKRIVCGDCAGCLKNDDCVTCRYCR